MFMQHPKTSQNTRKPWYERAMEMASLWKNFSKSADHHHIPSTLWKTISSSNKSSTAVLTTSTPNKQKLRKCTSLRVASSFTRVCLCAPISSYTEVFQSELPPRRSFSYPRSKAFPSPPERSIIAAARPSMEARKVFRGKSLKDDVLMKRFVLEEEAMMQMKRRNEMEVIRKRNAKRRKKLGPSPLSRMVLADQEEDRRNIEPTL
ncbi:uncharacterized protein LOC141681003 [Apium graveolens]|uniref:uncharacterized protein LOC141681003 n=1 Tax=Apium graveolens TaxID=4045 RepID=UPI003D7AE298